MANRRAEHNSGANLGFEDKLWAAADKLRGNMDAAEYKHVVLGLIFLKYISDAFMEKFNALKADDLADPEDKDECLADNIFWVPPEARWSYLQKNAKRPEIGSLVDDAMTAIEQDNKVLKGILPKDFARPALDKARLGEIIDLIATIGLGDAKSRQQDILGRVYEYFLEQFALAEGRKHGEFLTPHSVVNLLVEMIEPYRGRVYDPCCGSGGMFVQSMKFIRAHAKGNGNGGKVRADISIYGQIAHGDTFHPDLKAGYVLANPPFNDSDWRGELLKDDQRWAWGTSPAGNANYAWVQHSIHHLAPTGLAGFVLANGSMSSNQSGEGRVHKNSIEGRRIH